MIGTTGNRLVFIGLGVSDGTPAAAYFRRLADLSGGSFVTVADPKELGLVLRGIAVAPVGGTSGVGTLPKVGLGAGGWAAVLVGLNLLLLTAIVLLRRRR